MLLSAIKPNEHISISTWLASGEAILQFVREHRLEGVVAKRADSRYEPGKRSGIWTKTRIHLNQEFVVGGYTPSHLGIDALIVGFYRGERLLYAGRVRAGFSPRSRRAVLERIRHFETPRCPFANLPDKSAGPWGVGLTAEKLAKCIWVKPEAVAQIEFAEWTPNDRLRHASFLGMREDKKARAVVKES
jgi:ATP-dependent DNA ligase